MCAVWKCGRNKRSPKARACSKKQLVELQVEEMLLREDQIIWEIRLIKELILSINFDLIQLHQELQEFLNKWACWRNVLEQSVTVAIYALTTHTPTTCTPTTQPPPTHLLTIHPLTTINLYVRKFFFLYYTIWQHVPYLIVRLTNFFCPHCCWYYLEVALPETVTRTILPQAGGLNSTLFTIKIQAVPADQQFPSRVLGLLLFKP